MTTHKKSTNKQAYRLIALPYTKLILMLVGIALISLCTYLYFLPQHLQYSTSSNETASSTLQSAMVQVSGRYVTFHIFSGSSVLGYSFKLNSSPTLSKFDINGSKDIQLTVTLYQGDAAGEARNDDLAVRLLDPLEHGNYRVKVTVILWSQLKKGDYPTRTFVTNFQIR